MRLRLSLFLFVWLSTRAKHPQPQRLATLVPIALLILISAMCLRTRGALSKTATIITLFLGYVIGFGFAAFLALSGTCWLFILMYAVEQCSAHTRAISR